MMRTENIPKHEQGKEVFVCETCGAEHKLESAFSKCSICGREVCNSCRRVIFTFPDKILQYYHSGNSIGLSTFGCVDTYDKSTIVCGDCCGRIVYDNLEQYLSHVEELVRMFNTSIKELNRLYIEGKL